MKMLRIGKRLLWGAVVMAWFPASVSAIEISQTPLFIASNVPGNLALVPSVEYPTVISVANLGDYNQNTSYIGYFDAGKCYRYSSDNSESQRHFYPVSITTDHRCTGTGQWSGNFLNWATTQTIDPFRMVLTGGYRVKDTATETWLEKARHDRNELFPDRSISGSSVVSGATPFDASNFKVRIQGLDNQMRFRTGTGDFSSSASTYNGSYHNNNTTYTLSVRVKVCDPDVGVEANCVEYNNGWKPEGLIQAYSEDIRFSIFGYLNDSDASRDGGVMRAPQKYVGPRQYDAQQGWIDNPYKEWDAGTGVFVRNPDSDYATETSGSWDISIEDSGVINYLNKFGQLNDNNFKSHDPVSELYYTAHRYFRGLGPVAAYSSKGSANASTRRAWADNFPVIDDWSGIDPIQYACQANVILGIGDANTHRDKNLPGSTYGNNEPNKPTQVSQDSAINVVALTNLVGQLEGIGNIGSSSSFSGRDNSAFIAGLAYHAHTTDLRDDLEGDQTVSTHWVDVLENSYLEPINRNQYYLAAKYGGFRVPEGFDPASPESDMIQDQDWHTSGEMLYPGNQNNLSGQPIKRPDNYYLAGRADRMVASLEAAFATIVANIQASSASIAANSTRLDTDTLVFQARFNSASWRGDLFAYRLQSDGSLGSVPQWDAASVLDGMNLADRNVLFAGSSGTLEPFSWENLSAAQRTILNNNDLGESRIAYLTGNRTQERQNGGPFRTRSSRLGDIVNSNPAFSGQESYGYHRLPGAEGSSYYSFYQQKRNEELRPPVVYVGANDGMLHAFHADTGEELFAYVPSMVLPQMAALSEPGYEHRYSVDGSPTIADAYIDGEWRTVLIGALGAGGRGLFALDITHPNEPELLWEFTHPELGEGVEEVSVVRTEVGNQDDPKWIVALGNGYNSASGQAALLLIDLASGEMLAESPVYTGAGSVDEPNGMAAVIAISSSGGRTADTMYAGDLQGNLWKFDQIQANGNNKGVWRLADGEDEPLFTAVSPDQGAPRQPITSKPEAGFNSDGQVMIYFGTGKYLEAVDVESSGLRFTHSAYGIVDDGSLGITRDDLIEQEIIYEDTAHDRQVRVVSNNPRTENSMGWYLDLVPPGNNGESNGERIVVRPVLRGESVVFVTLIPSSSPCDTGGTSWMMALSRDTGGRIDGGVFDVDGDGVVDENDYVVIDGVEVPVSGLGSESGILTRPNILAGIDGVDSGYVTGSTGDTERFNIQGDGTGLGRQSWRQLR